jgi:hypothetical protein
MWFKVLIFEEQRSATQDAKHSMSMRWDRIAVARAQRAMAIGMLLF